MMARSARPALIHPEAIADAVLDDEAFSDVLKTLAHQTGARSYIAGWASYGMTRVDAFSMQWTAENIAEYETRFAAADVWSNAMLRTWRPGRALDLSDLVSDREFEMSYLHNEFFRVIGDDTYRTLALPSQARWGKGNIGFHRGKSSKGFDADIVKRLDFHAGHLGCLLAARARLAAADGANATYKEMFDRLGQAVLLVRGDCKILHGNAVAEHMLAAGVAVRQSQGKLFAMASEAERPLIEAVARVSVARGFPAESILLPLRDGKAIQATLVPVQNGPFSRHVMIIIPIAESGDPSIEPRLRKLYGLSGAEAAIAAGLAEGSTIRELADLRGTSIHTVRLQAKRVLEKLGCRRQSEVVRLIKQIAPVHPPSSG